MIWKKLRQKRIWKRILLERLTEPIHLNILSAFVWVFGTYRLKIAFDLVERRQHAYGLLRAAERARRMGLKTLTAVEFGVASGTGLVNLSLIAEKITKITGVQFKIAGFDSGKGMPKARDYRDHPDIYQEGDFPMESSRLLQALPHNTRLVLGDLSETVPAFIKEMSPSEPIGFVSLDVDYYHSAKEALKIFNGAPHLYLPIVYIYVDDLEWEEHNSRCGEWLALLEFNREQDRRIVEQYSFLTNNRIFKNANWIRHMYQLHMLDHPVRSEISKRPERAVINNPYL